MKRLLGSILIALILTVTLMPATAVGQPPVLSVGSMSSQQSVWSIASIQATEDVFEYRWQWNVSSENASGNHGYLVMTVRYDGSDPNINENYDLSRVVDRVSTPVTGVRRVSDNEIEFTVETPPYTPGDPVWGTELFRVVDNGKNGDYLLQYCWQHDEFHLLAAEGRARVR